LSGLLYKMCEETIKYIPEVRVKFVRRQLKKRCYRKNVVACASSLLRLIMLLIKENRLYQVRTNRSAECLMFLEKKYASLKRKDKARFGKKVA